MLDGCDASLAEKRVGVKIKGWRMRVCIEGAGPHV